MDYKFQKYIEKQESEFLKQKVNGTDLIRISDANNYFNSYKQQLILSDVGSSTSLPIDYCPKCKSNDIRQYTKTNDKCNNCNHAWYVYKPFKGVE